MRPEEFHHEVEVLPDSEAHRRDEQSTRGVRMIIAITLP